MTITNNTREYGVLYAHSSTMWGGQLVTPFGTRYAAIATIATAPRHGFEAVLMTREGPNGTWVDHHGRTAERVIHDYNTICNDLKRKRHPKFGDVPGAR